MIEPGDLFHSRHYELQRRPLPESRTLPAWCYTSEEFYRRERERIFLHAWQFVRAHRRDSFFGGLPVLR